MAAAVLLGAAFSSAGATHRWMNVSEVAGGAATSLGKTSIIFAGNKVAPPQYNTADVIVFNASTGLWAVHRGALSAARAELAATSSLDGEWALFGGGETADKTKHAELDVFSTLTREWSTASLGQRRSFLAASTVVAPNGTEFSLFGGGELMEGPSGTDSAWVDVFIHTSGGVVFDHSASGNKLSKPRKKLAAAAANGLLLFGGGYRSGEKNSTSRGYCDEVDIFHARNMSWTTARLSQPRQYITAATAHNSVLFGGGFCSPCVGQPGTDRSFVVDIFDTETLQWSVHRLSQRRSNLAAATVGGRYAVFSGGTTDVTGAVTRSNHVDVFDGLVKAWFLAPSLKVERCCLACGGTLSKMSLVCAGGCDPNVADIYNFTQLGTRSDVTSVPVPILDPQENEHRLI